jgi:hypothetical protein
MLKAACWRFVDKKSPYVGVWNRSEKKGRAFFPYSLFTALADSGYLLHLAPAVRAPAGEAAVADAQEGLRRIGYLCRKRTLYV